MNTEYRINLISKLTTEILHLKNDFVLRVGIDGVDGSGKTIFADELTKALKAVGASVIRASVDGFHNLRGTRYRRGRLSPEGFYLDSYNYPSLKQNLLDPLSLNGTGFYRTAMFDHKIDKAVDVPLEQAHVGDILIFDGIFIHRPELRDYWDLSIFLDVDFENSIPRLGKRDNGPTEIHAEVNRRYIEGQLFYLRECSPAEAATMVIDNNDYHHPFITR